MSVAVALGASDCERIGSGLLAQPANAVSSLAYFAAATAVLVPARRMTGRQRAGFVTFAVSLAAVGAGSFAYHGPQPSWAEQVHDGSIAAVLVVAATAPGLRRGLTKGGKPLVGLAVLAVAAYAAGRSNSPVCATDSALQPHALWHALTAALAVVLARAANAETRTTAGP